MSRLQGKVAIVTGGAKGIGRHYSLALAQHGAKVMVADIADGKDIVAEITKAGGSAATTICDVADEMSVKAMVAETMKALGQIDILVNNAALYSTLTPRAFGEWDADLWDKVMAVNIKGSYLTVRHAAPHMIARKSGKIINIASGTPYKGIPRMLPYVTSKGAIIAFTRALSRELGEHNICVNTLSPGLILSDTGLTNTAHIEEEQVKIRNTRAFKRDAYPEDLLGGLIFLASDDSNFVTGQSLVVDGGSVNN